MVPDFQDCIKLFIYVNVYIMNHTAISRLPLSVTVCMFLSSFVHVLAIAWVCFAFFNVKDCVFPQMMGETRWQYTEIINYNVEPWSMSFYLRKCRRMSCLCLSQSNQICFSCYHVIIHHVESRIIMSHHITSTESSNNINCNENQIRV